MRSTKLFATLAGTALLAACTQEELVEVENVSQTMEEVVGTKLIGTDVSMKVSLDGVETRYAGGEKTWGEDDVIGLSWIVYESPYIDQSVDNQVNKEELYSNLMFAYNECDGDFTTQGNIYQGWHMAYFPWNRMSKVEQKVFTVNPPQKKADAGKELNVRKSQALHLSNRMFLDETSVDADNNLTVKFEYNAAVNFMNIRTHAAEGTEFANKSNTLLGGQPIKSVTVNVGEGNDIFAETLTLNPSKLPAWTNVVADEFKNDEDALKKTNTKAFQTAWKEVLTTETWTNTVTTDVAATGYTVADDTKLITIVAPHDAVELEKEAITITVTLANDSKFEIAYTTDPVKDSYAAKNNATIEKFVEAWGSKKKGVTHSGAYLVAADQSVGFDVYLYEEIFDTEATFNAISDFGEWENAVNMVNYLGRPEQKFIIDGNIDFTNKVLMPTVEGCTITAERKNYDNRMDQQFVLHGTFNEWPTNLVSGADVYITVAEGCTLNVADELPKTAIHNKGYIDVKVGTADKNTVVGDQNENYSLVNTGLIHVNMYGALYHLDNSNGRVEIEWGAFVYPKDGKDGVIAYTVTEDDVKEPSRIAQLTAENGVGATEDQSAWAQVNTLIVNEGIEIDFTKVIPGGTIQGSSNPYAPKEEGKADDKTVDFGSMEKVDFEINGGAISSSTEEVTVKNVKLNGGTIDKTIKIAGDLTIESGKEMIIEVSAIGGALNAKDGSGSITTGNIAKASQLNGAYALTAADINGSLTLTGNNTIKADAVKGDITATGENYFEAETIDGNVNLTNTSVNTCHIIGANINGDVTLTGNHCLNNVNVNGNVTVVSGQLKALDTQISGTLTIEGTENNEKLYCAIDSENEVIIGNIVVKESGILNVNTEVTTATVKNYGKLFVASEKTLWYTTAKSEGGLIQVGLTGGVVEYKGDADAVVFTAKDFAAAVMGENETIEVKLGANIDVPITSLGQITPSSGEYKLGGENTKAILIDLNGYKLNIATTYWSAIGAKNADATITIKNGIMTSTGNSAGTWNAWDVRFSNCDCVIEDVTFEKEVALDNAGKSATLNNVTIKGTGDKYALWITAEGQNVTIDGLTVDSEGRGIKIDEQYVSNAEKVTLKVSDSKFKTAVKSAIMVKSVAGADITLSNIDITEVAADKVNAVWVDEDSKDYFDLVTVKGGTKVQE